MTAVAMFELESKLRSKQIYNDKGFYRRPQLQDPKAFNIPI